MPYRDIEKSRAASRRHYEKYKGVTIDRKKARRQALKLWLAEQKSNIYCVKCGENDPVVLDFHHREPGTKDFSISDAVHRGLSIDRVLSEISKCDVLCANCHRRLHYTERLPRSPSGEFTVPR